MHLVKFTRPTDDQKIAQRIERGKLCVYELAHGGGVWAGYEDEPDEPVESIEPEEFYDPIKRTGTDG